MSKSVNSNSSVTALILAGGQASRMQGRDKGQVRLWGKPMVEHVIDRIGGQVDNIVISANRNSELYARYGFPVLADDLGHSWGPLAGVYTAMRFVGGGYLLVVPCDTPCLPIDLSQVLQQALRAGGGQVVVADDGERPQFTVALIPCNLVENLKDYLERGERRVETWLRQFRFEVVAFPESGTAFANVNSTEELEAMERKGGC
jgi:molybdopterin-guanine dinucleotide biosynthesis protein A